LAVTATAFQNLQSTAVGGSASLTAGVAGSAAVNDLNYTTLAYVSQGASVTATNGSPGNGPGVMVTAADPLTLLSTSGALAAGGDVGLGAGVDVDSITKNTQAYIATAAVTADGDVLVQASSAENLASVTAAVGASGTTAVVGSAGVYVLLITTRAFIGDDPDNPTSGATTVQASGSILVAASEQTVLNILSGNISGSGTASVGAAAGVPVITKTTEAFIGAGAQVGALGLGNGVEAANGQFAISYAPYSTAVGVVEPKPISANLTGSGNSLTSPRLSQERIATPVTQTDAGLAVTAVNSDALQGVGVDGGVSGTAAMNLSGSVAVLTNHTDAYIGSGALINANNSDADSGQSVLVAAGNDASFLGIAAAVSISGTASITPGVVLVVINNTTIAAVDDGANVTAAGDIEVEAHSSGDVLSIAAAGAVAGTAAVGGSVSYVSVNDTTWAYIGYSATTDSGGAQVSAGGSVLVDATDDTVAYLITGSLSVGATGAGVGGAVGIALLDKDTEAFIGSHATVNALGNGSSVPGIYSGAGFGTDDLFYGVAVQASTSENVTNVVAAGSFGFFAGLAGGVSVEIFNSNTQGYIGPDAHVNTSASGASSNQAVTVSAANQATDFSFAGGLGGGIAGVAGGVDVGLMNNSTQAYIGNGSVVDALLYVGVYSLTDDSVQTYALGAAAGIVGLVGSVSVWSIGSPYSAGYTDGNASDGTILALPANGLSGSSTNAEGQTGGASALIGSLSDPNNNGAAGNTQDTSASISSAQSGLSGSITGDPVATAVDSTAAPLGTVAFIGSSASVTAGGDVNLEADSEVSYTGTVGGLSAGAVGIGGSVEIANIDANTQSYIDQNATVSSGGELTVDADLDDDNSNGTAFAGTAGTVGLGAQVVDIQDSSTVSATLNSGVTIPQAADGVDITADSYRHLTAQALGGDFGGVAAGVGVAIASAKGGTSAGIGSGAQIGQTGTVDDVNVDADSDDNTTAESDGVAAGANGATAVYSSAVSDPTVSASISGNVNVSGEIYDSADTDDDASATALGVTVSAGASLGASVASADVSPNVSAELGAGAQLQAGTGIIVSAFNDISSDGYTFSQGADSMAGSGAGAIVVGAAGSDATSTASPTFDASVATGASLTTGGDISLDAGSGDDADAQAVGAGLGIIGVGISIATATDAGTTDAHSDANVNLTAGDDVSIGASDNEVATADSTAGSGGIVAGDGADGTATIKPTITATTGAGSQINAAEEVSVLAGVTPEATAQVTGVSAGALAVGASVATATDSPMVTSIAGGAGTTIIGETLDAGVANYLPSPHVSEGSIVRPLISSGGSFSTNSTDSASASASGSAGALFGATATSSTANNAGSVTTSIASGTTLYISSAINIEANTFTDQTSLSTSNFGGIIAAGSNTATAESSDKTTATVGTDVAISPGDAVGGLQDGTIYYVVPDPSNPDLISLASSPQNALMSSGGNLPQPGSGAITIALSQPEVSVGDHLLTAVDVVGATPVGFDPATALSTKGGTSYIDVGPNSFYLGEPVEYQQSGGPALSITADGDDINYAQAVAGSGGVVAGAAAMANTNTAGSTSASIADNTGPGTSLDVSSLLLSALHTSQFDTQTDTTQAAAVGFSGSWDSNTDTSTVNAHIGSYAQIITQSVQVLATNTTEKNLVPAGQNNVSAGSGGVLLGNAAQSTTTIANDTTADVGANANINVTGSITNPGLFELYALNNVDASDTVNLDTGGVIDGSDATSTIDAGTNDATAQIGANATIVTVGDVNLDTRTTGSITVAPTVHTYGLASPGSIDGEAEIAEDDAVNVGAGAFIQAQGNLNLIAGGDMNGDLNNLTTASNAYELNASAVPAFDLVSKCEVDQTNTVNVGAGAMLLAAGNANLMAEQNGTAATNAVGTGKDWLTAVASSVVSLLGGNGDSADVHAGTNIANTTTSVTVNGTIELGINNIQSLTIQKDLVDNPTDYTVSGPISFTQETENLVDDLTTELADLQNLVKEYAGDTAAVSAYESEIQQVEFELAQLGLSETESDGSVVSAGAVDAVPFIILSPIFADAGTIYVNGANFEGSGSLIAPSGVSITITNNSPAYLSVGTITIPQSSGAGVFFDGNTVTSNSGIGHVNQNQTAPSFTIQATSIPITPTITITNTYSASDPANAGYKGDNFSTPDVDLNGNISAPSAVLTVTSQGNVVANANVDVKTVTVSAAGSFVQSYVAGIDNIAGDPSTSTAWTNVTNLTQANAAATNPSPPLGSPLDVNGNSSSTATPVEQAVAAALATPGTGNIIVANDVFVSAQYLNIDGTIQSGEPDQQVTISDTYQEMYNPDIPGTTIYGTMTGAISDAVSAYQDFENGDLSDAQSSVSFNGLFTTDYKEFLLPEAMTDNIDVYYDAPTGQLVLGQSDVQGGLVELYGDVLSTGGGNINVLDGYGAINVTNDTSYPLVTSGLSTGQGTAGLLKITDTGKESLVVTNPLHPEYLPLVTEYYRQDGQVYTTSYYANPDGSVAQVVSSPSQYSGPGAGPRTASYQPATARFVWENGQSGSVTTTNVYEVVGLFTPAIDLSSSDLVGTATTAGAPPAPLPNGEWIANAATEPSLANVVPGTGVDSYDYTYSFAQIPNGTPTTEGPFQSEDTTWYGVDDFYTRTITITPVLNINTNTIRADLPINVTFTGYDAGAAGQVVSVSTQGDLLIDGSIENAAGSTTLSAPDGSIQQENSGAIVGGQNITLTALSGIGGTAPVLIDMTNSSTAPYTALGTLNATSTSGSINLDDFSGSITIGQITTSAATGNVALTADLSILAANASSLVQGGAVTLTASFGSVGSLGTGGTADAPASDALPIIVNVGSATADSLQVTAQDDVFVRQSTGDLRLDKIDSSTGNIRVEVPDGDLVDANNISVPDTQNLSELEAQWNSMLATQSTAQISIDDTINAYQNEIDQEYQTYWTFRDEQPDPSVFDPNFHVTLPAGQLAAWTTYYTNEGTAQGISGTALATFVSNALTALASADTAEYDTYNAIFGKLGSSYDPSFMYFANQTPLSGSVTLTFGPADIDPTGTLIDLPGNGYITGQAVVYNANGGLVGGLTSGSTYYVIVDPDDSNEISLAASYEDATDSSPIQLSKVSGTGNSLSDIFASPNEVFGPASLQFNELISLPGNAYTNGQAVVYHANGGSVGGLTDGDTYYVITGSDASQIGLASSYANTIGPNPVYIQLSSVTGTDNVLSTIFQTFGASQVDPTGLSIDLPQNVFTPGQAVIYHSGGGSVGGLTDGDTYYVIVDPNHTGSSAFVGLATSYANATGATPVPIKLTSVTGTGNYLSEVDVLAERAAWTQSQLQNSMSLSILEPTLFPSTVQAIPDPNLEGKNVALVVSGSVGTVTGQDTIPLPLTGALPEQEALDLAAAQPADITFYNAGPNNTLVMVVPTDPSFNPVELTINLQKGISLENTGVVDATAGQNIDLDSGQDVANQGALLPITLDQVTAQGGVSSGPADGVVRILGLDGIVSGAPAGDTNIEGGDLYLEGGNTGGIGTSLLPVVIDLAPTALLEEANAELSVYLSEASGDLNLVSAFSATGDVDLTAGGSILNGNTFNDLNVDAVGAVLMAGDNIGSSASPFMTTIGDLQAEATTGSIWLVNTGALSIVSVQAGGAVNITAMSPITITKSLSTVGDITLTSTHDSSRGDMVAASGASIDSSAGSVFLQAGDNFTQDAGDSIQAAGSITITGDYGNLSGTGSQIALSGLIGAPSVVIDANGASANVDLNDPSGLSSTPGDPGEQLTVNGGSGDTTFTAQLSGNFAAELTLLNVADVTAFTIAGDMSGQLAGPTTISTMSIGGSLTSTGSITAGNINDLAIEQVLAGQVKVTGYLNSLTVGGAVTGSYSAGQLGRVVVDGVVVNNPPPPPPPPPPPLVIVTSLHWETIKVRAGTGKKAKTKSETVLEIDFSGLVAGAGDLAAYQIASVATKKVKKKPVTTYKPIKLASALPATSPMASSVSLVPAAKPKLGQTDRLEIVATDLTDSLGRALDGNDDGLPGANFVATFGKSGVSDDLVEPARAQRHRAAKTDVIDALLAGGELGGVRRAVLAERDAKVVSK
jgi:hypothetical protein